MSTPADVPQFVTAEYQPDTPDTRALYMRGVLFGAGGAALGLVLYSAVGIITGLEIGFVALAVGWIVGKSIVKGSRGRTGRRYQVAAALLTYAAVSVSAVPISISLMLSGHETAAGSGVVDGERAGQVTGAAPAAADTASATEAGDVNVGLLLGSLLFIGLASPLLGLMELPGGVIGLIILAVGIRIAWQITGGTPEAVREALAGAGGPHDPPTSLNLNR